jgi:hypothetical protein
MRKLSTEKRAAILSALVEGSSINAMARMNSYSKITVLRLLADAGTLCADYHNLLVRRLKSQHVQMDEIWAFVGCKAKAKARGAKGHGDIWTWTAIDADSKVRVSFRLGSRNGETATAFVKDVADSPAECCGTRREVIQGNFRIRVPGCFGGNFEGSESSADRHCWACKGAIGDADRCPTCGWFICWCGACSPECADG